MSTLDDVNELPLAEPRTWTRRGDRRSDLRQVLEALAHAIRLPSEERSLPALFERELRRVLSVRAVRLREVPARYQARLVTPTRTSESLVLNVLTSEPGRQAVLEAAFDPGTHMDDWNVDLLKAAAHLGALVLEAERHRARVGSSRRFDGAAPLIGSTSVMHDLRDRVERVAVTDFTLLIEGESGTGKELVARQIHELSWRRRGPFVPINCAALVETLLEAELFGIEERTATGVRGRRGKFEHADGGTMFLDEISDLSMSAQAKLLRAIQELAVERVGGNGTHRVDIRIVAATNRSLRDLVERRLFRPDLFYRLSGVDVRVPTLRERRADVQELAAYFLERHRHTRQLKLSEVALQALRAYDWPGNVRELERLMERAVALTTGDVIELDDLSPVVGGDYSEILLPSFKRNDTLRVWACRYTRLMLDRCQGNRREAARVLGISYHTLTTYLKAGDIGLGVVAEPATSVAEEDP